MAQNDKNGHWALKPQHLILLFALLQLFVALFTESLSFTQEEAMWHYIGRNWFRHGLVPYAGGIDNKSPFIFSVFGFSDWLFGVNYWFPRLLGTIAQSLGIFFVFKIASRLAGRNSGILAIIIYGLSLTWRSTGGKYVSFTETYAILFLLMSYYYCFSGTKQKSFFASGLIAGFGFICRFSTGFGIVAIFIMLTRKNRLAPFSFISGVLVSAALLTGIFCLADIDPHDILEYGFVENFGVGSITDRSLSWKLENFANGFFYSELVLFYPFVIAYFFTGKATRMLNIWLACEFIGIIALGIFARNHFKQLLPVMAIMSSISLAWLVDKYKVPLRPVVLIICIAFFPKTWEPLFGLKKILAGIETKSKDFCQHPFPQPDEYSKKQLGLWIRANTGRSELVYVAGTGSQIQAYSERLSPSVYFNATHTKKAKEQLFRDLVNNKADWILVPKFAEYEKHVQKDIREFISLLISKEYSYEQCMFAYDIFRLKNMP